MRQIPAALAVLAVLGLPSLSSAQQRPDLPAFALDVPEIQSGEPVFAFNGKDLTGFSTYLKEHKHEDPNGVFSVKDGVIRVSGQEYGGFATKEEYGDYHLVVEWRWGGKTWPPRAGRARDSGVLFHAVGPDGAAGKGAWMESIECNIIEGGCGDFILVGGQGHPELSCVVRKDQKGQLYFDPAQGEKVTRQSGRYNWWGRAPNWEDSLGFRGAWKIQKPSGKWNRLEIVCDGDTVLVILNGVLVNQGTGSNRTRGKIQFQSEGAEILFRKIEVRPLRKP